MFLNITILVFSHLNKAAKHTLLSHLIVGAWYFTWCLLLPWGWRTSLFGLTFPWNVVILLVCESIISYRTELFFLISQNPCAYHPYMMVTQLSNTGIFQHLLQQPIQIFCTNIYQYYYIQSTVSSLSIYINTTILQYFPVRNVTQNLYSTKLFLIAQVTMNFLTGFQTWEISHTSDRDKPSIILFQFWWRLV